MKVNLDTPVVFLHFTKADLVSQWLAPPAGAGWTEEDLELVLGLVQHALDWDDETTFPYQGEDALRDALQEAREEGLMRPGDPYCVTTARELWRAVADYVAEEES